MQLTQYPLEVLHIITHICSIASFDISFVSCCAETIGSGGYLDNHSSHVACVRCIDGIERECFPRVARLAHFAHSREHCRLVHFDNAHENVAASVSASKASDSSDPTRMNGERRSTITLPVAALDVGSALQAIWCFGRLSVHATLDQVHNEHVDVADLSQRLLEALLRAEQPHAASGVSSPNWSAVAVCVRVLAALCQTFRELCTSIARYGMPLVGRALTRLSKNDYPDPDASASFSLLLAALSQSATARLHLNITIAEAVLNLLRTATQTDGTMTVAAAGAFVRVLCSIAATDRRGQVRAVLLRNRLSIFVPLQI